MYILHNIYCWFNMWLQMCISISEQAYMWGLFINCGSSEAFFINSFLDGSWNCW